MTEPKTPAEEWLERSKPGDQNLSVVCPKCLRPVPVVDEVGGGVEEPDLYCACGETTTTQEILEAHGLVELLPRMWYGRADRQNES